MVLKLESPLFALEPGAVVTLDDAAGTCIRARHGVVWVTEEGSSADHIVRSGESHVVGHGGRTVVQALETAWLSLRETPCPALTA